MPSIRALFISTLLFFCTVLSQAEEMPKLQVQDGHKSEVLAMWVSDDGLRAVTVGEEGAVKIWDLVGNHVEKTLIDREGLKESDSTARFNAAWADESGAWASSGSEIKYFDLKQGRVTRRFPTSIPAPKPLSSTVSSSTSSRMESESSLLTAKKWLQSIRWVVSRTPRCKVDESQ